MRTAALRLAGLAVALWAVFFASRAVWLATLEPEEHLRRRLAEMSDGFNETRLGRALAGIADDFRAEPEGVDRHTLRRGLAALFLRGIDPGTRRFAWRLELPPEEIDVRFEAPGEVLAEVRLTARFYRSSDGEEQLAWVVSAQGTMEDRDDEGWVVVRVEATTLEGRRPRL